MAAFDASKIIFAGLCLVLSACGTMATRDSGPVEIPVDLDALPDAVPKEEPLSRYGNPAKYEVFGKTYSTLPSAKGYTARGVASWYGRKFHGQRTSSGEPYDMFAMTAAHKHLPLPSYVEVINLENNRRVVVKVNDRGPFHSDRIIDLSYAAAYKLGYADKGTAMVEIRAIDPNPPAVKSMPTVASVSKETASGNHYIQVGAFSNKENADKLFFQLREAALRAYIKPIDQSPGVYRVQIGPYPSRDEADATLPRLSALGLSGFKVVNE